MNYDYRYLDLSTFHPGLSASLMTAEGQEDDREGGDDRFVALDCDGGDVSTHITPTLLAHLGQHFHEFLVPCDGGAQVYTGATKAESGTRLYLRRRDECPCCGEVFSFTPNADGDGDDGVIECGGDGMGSCAGILAALSTDPAAEWPSLMAHTGDAEPYPGDELIAVYRARYDAFVATLGCSLPPTVGAVAHLMR